MLLVGCAAVRSAFAAYTEIVAAWCLPELPARATLLYSAGGRFLIGVPAFPNWQEKVKDMQAQIDAWALETFGRRTRV